MDAKKNRIGAAKAVQIARSVAKVCVAKGKKYQAFDTSGVSDQELKKSLLGPSGNLRAPSMIQGDTLYVGFHQERFPELLSP